MINGIQNNLPRILFERGMSINELSSQAGIPYATLHGIVNGQKKGITFQQMSLICKTLNLNVGDIYEVAKK